MLLNFINKLSNIISIMVLGEGKLLGPLNRSGKSSGAGQALGKHKTGSRGESAFPAARGNPTAINEQGQRIVEGIVTHPKRIVKIKESDFINERYNGPVVDIRDSSGKGVRFSGDGTKLIGFLEPD